jgi:uncharacterized coiled-coil protein SlyX
MKWAKLKYFLSVLLVASLLLPLYSQPYYSGPVLPLGWLPIHETELTELEVILTEQQTELDKQRMQLDKLNQSLSISKQALIQSQTALLEAKQSWSESVTAQKIRNVQTALVSFGIGAAVGSITALILMYK